MAEKTEALRLISISTNTSRPTGQDRIDISTANPLQEIDPELLRYETEVAIGGKADDADIEEHRRSLIGAGYAWGVQGDVFDYDTWANHLSASMVGRGNTDNRTDPETGAYLDKAHVSMLDAEYMFEARLVERRCLNGVPGYAHLNLVQPDGSTYSFLEKNPIQRTSSGQKRTRMKEPPRMRASSCGADAEPVCGTSAAWRAIGRADGDRPARRGLALRVRERERTGWVVCTP